MRAKMRRPRVLRIDANILIFLRLSAGRSEWIRTTGPCLPKTVLYQAELHSDLRRFIASSGRWSQVAAKSQIGFACM